MVLGAFDPGLAAILVALLAPLASYLVAVRQLSGRIKNSDASELWEESRSIREWSAARITELLDHIHLLENRVEELESINRALADENTRLKIEAQHQFGPHIDLSSQIEGTEGENESR